LDGWDIVVVKGFYLIQIAKPKGCVCEDLDSHVVARFVSLDFGLNPVNIVTWGIGNAALLV
jgi:hypothetical protein